MSSELSTIGCSLGVSAPYFFSIAPRSPTLGCRVILLGDHADHRDKVRKKMDAIRVAPQRLRRYAASTRRPACPPVLWPNNRSSPTAAVKASIHHFTFL
jgi:hypothetical protein